MILETSLRCHGRPVYRDARTGRFAPLAAWLDQQAAQALADRQRAEATAPGRATRHLIYQAVPPVRAPRKQTKGEAAWRRRNPVAWGHVEV
jgi:hypothetical protein